MVKKKIIDLEKIVKEDNFNELQILKGLDNKTIMWEYYQKTPIKEIATIVGLKEDQVNLAIYQMRLDNPNRIENRLTPDQLKQLKKDYLSGELTKRDLFKKYNLFKEALKDFADRYGLPSPNEVRGRNIEERMMKVKSLFNKGLTPVEIAEKLGLKYIIVANDLHAQGIDLKY